jgi:hypothetical protein
VTHPSTVRDLLDRAGVERAAGRGDSAARLYDEAVTRCRNDDDLVGWTEAVLGAAAVYLFGAEPGRLPAQLYDVLARTTDEATRARLGAALARCWAYAAQPGRAVQFADEAVDGARLIGSPELLADCLDAALASHWGPDELDVRRTLATQLDDVAAHVLDPDVRLQAHLWSLQVACETLDVQSIHRQMRALERLGDESPRALFFAASRRLMLDLLRGRTDTAEHLRSVAETAAKQASLADAWLVLKAMEFYTAAQSGDTDGCAAGAAEVEAFALAEGATAVCAEAAFLWACAGRLDRARVLVHSFRGPVLDDLIRDVNWLLTLQCVLEAALAVGDLNVVETANRLLAPYEDRAVINAGAVMFHGVTDDTLARAAAVLGDTATASRLRTRALATYERLGAQWWRRRLAAWQPPTEDGDEPDRPRQAHLRPLPGGLWLIGRDEAAAPLRALRGFGYLRELVRRPRQPVSALDLVGSGGAVAAQSGLGELLDRQALTAYRQRLLDLDRDLTEAQEWADLGRLDTLHTERDALLAELARATGLNGRNRTIGSSQERARIAVQKTISAAINRIETIDPPLAQHLRNSIHTGLNCSYEPDPRDHLRWALD